MKIIRQIIKLLNKAEKKHLIILSLLMVIGAILETISLGVVIPAISILINGVDGILNYSILRNINFDIKSFDEKFLTIVIFLTLFFIFFTKSIFLVFIYFFQFKFSSNLLARLTNEMFEKIIHQPYYVFLKKNTSKYLNTLSNETRVFIDLCIEPLLSLVSESIVFLFIIILLIIFEPVGTLLISVTLLVAVSIFYILTKNKSREWGIQRQESEQELIKSMQEPFHGIKEVKIFNTTEYIFSIFKKNLNLSTNARKKILILLHLPRIWLEISAFLTMTLLVLFTLYLNRELSEIIPILAVFAAAAFRIIPSTNRILISFQNLRYGLAAADILVGHSNEIKKLNFNKNLIIQNKLNEKFKSLELKNIYFDYKDNNRAIFKNLNFKINQGDCIGIIGTTGAGKSTFVDLLCGLLKPDKGEIYLNDKKIILNEINWENKIGYVPQNYYLLDRTIVENIAFGLKKSEIDIKKINNAIKYAQLEDFISNLPNKLDTAVGERGVRLSGGQKQRLAIARALYFDPEIIIFDEATSSLDLKTEEDLINTIKNLIGQKTLIIVSHRMNSLKNCNKIFSVNRLNLKQVLNDKFVFDE